MAPWGGTICRHAGRRQDGWCLVVSRQLEPKRLRARNLQVTAVTARMAPVCILCICICASVHPRIHASTASTIFFVYTARANPLPNRPPKQPFWSHPTGSQRSQRSQPVTHPGLSGPSGGCGTPMDPLPMDPLDVLPDPNQGCRVPF